MDTGSTGSSDGLSKMGWGCGQDEEGITTSVFVFAVDGKSHSNAIPVLIFDHHLQSLYALDSRTISPAYSKPETSVSNINIIFLLSPMSVA